MLLCHQLAPAYLPINVSTKMFATDFAWLSRHEKNLLSYNTIGNFLLTLTKINHLLKIEVRFSHNLLLNLSLRNVNMITFLMSVTNILVWTCFYDEWMFWTRTYQPYFITKTLVNCLFCFRSFAVKTECGMTIIFWTHSTALHLFQNPYTFHLTKRAKICKFSVLDQIFASI